MKSFLSLVHLLMVFSLVVFQTTVACQSVLPTADFVNPTPTNQQTLPSLALFTPGRTPTPDMRTATPTATPTLIPLTATITPLPTSSSTSTPSRPWRIMPLGDSLTSGNYPGRVHSYRGYLETLLREAGYSFDFVGTQSRFAHGGEDSDNEGHSGFTIGPDEARLCEECSTINLYDHLEEYLQTEPDIILLLIGINDMLPLDVRPVEPEDAPGKLAGLVKRIEELRPNVYIFLASLVPVNYRDDLRWLPYQAVNQMAEQIAGADPRDNIYFVDIYQVLKQTLNRKTDFSDGIHLAEGGARKLALVWFNALVGSELFLNAAP